MKKSKKMRAIAGAVLVMTGGVAAAQALPTPLVTAVQKAVVTNPEVQARCAGVNTPVPSPMAKPPPPATSPRST